MKTSLLQGLHESCKNALQEWARITQLGVAVMVAFCSSGQLSSAPAGPPPAPLPGQNAEVGEPEQAAPELAVRSCKQCSIRHALVQEPHSNKTSLPAPEPWIRYES